MILKVSLLVLYNGFVSARMTAPKIYKKIQRKIQISACVTACMVTFISSIYLDNHPIMIYYAGHFYPNQLPSKMVKLAFCSEELELSEKIGTKQFIHHRFQHTTNKTCSKVHCFLHCMMCTLFWIMVIRLQGTVDDMLLYAVLLEGFVMTLTKWPDFRIWIDEATCREC